MTLFLGRAHRHVVLACGVESDVECMVECYFCHPDQVQLVWVDFLL
jgi:hypothetical protein